MKNQEIESAVKAFSENPFWKDIYGKAPEGAKKYLGATFALSERDEEPTDEDIVYLKAVEKSLTPEDRKYLANNLPNAQARAHFKGDK